MTKRKTLLILIVVALMVTAFSLQACSTSSPIKSISVEGEYKTAYIIGEELNTAGMNLRITYENGEDKVLAINDIKSSVVIMNFDTLNEGLGKSVIVRYNGVETTFKVSVYTAEDYEQRFTVTFDSNGGSEVAASFATANGTLVAPEEPSLSGYAFDGWYKDTTLSNKWNFNTDKITGNITLYAKWAKLYAVTFSISGMDDIVKFVKTGGELTDIPQVPEVAGKNGAWDRLSYTNITTDIYVKAVYTDIMYTVGFYDYDGDDNEKEMLVFTNVGYGTDIATEKAQDIADLEIALVNNPNRVNYHFVGWQEEFDFITSDIKVYAKYERDTHTVSYVNAIDGEVIETYSTTSAYYDAVIPAPQTPIREGYEFDGWYKDYAYASPWVFSSDRVKADRILYAKWTKLWTLTFKYENGDVYEEVQVRDGEDAVVPSVPEVTGYSGVWERELFTDITADDTIIPIYTIMSYTVRFFNWDQSVILVDGEESQIIEYDSPAKVPAETPTREGYTFDAWSIDPEHITRESDIIAQFDVNMYTVTYQTNYSGYVKNPVSVAYGSRIEGLADEEPTRDGYEFDGWFTDEVFSDSWNPLTDLVKEAITLYAKWTQVFKLSFTYLLGGQQSTIYREVRKGEFLTDVPDVPADVGKIGTWKFANGSSIDFATYPVNSDQAFNAQYTIAQYYVTFHFDDDNNDFIIPVEHGNIVPGIPTEPANPEKTGYTFVSWDKDPMTTIITGPTVFYPQYKINQYTVQFILKAEDAGTTEDVLLKETSVDYGSSAMAPDERPTKDGYSFAGWDKSFSVVVGDTEVYATFVIRSFNVSFRDDGNNIFYEVESVIYNTTVPFAGTNPSIEGWDFVGWDYDGDGEFDFIADNFANNPITDNKVILAKFKKTILSVQFFSGEGGSYVEDQDVEYGKRIDEVIPKNSVETKAFFGWYLESEFINRFDFRTVITENIELYARWENMESGTADDVVYVYDALKDAYRVDTVSPTATFVIIANIFTDSKTGKSASVTSIGAYAMKNCTSLMAVYIPSTITSIGIGAFSGCSSLSIVCQGIDGNPRMDDDNNYIMPDNVEIIGDNAFEGCTSLENLNFDPTYSKLKEIGENAFSGCSKLKGFNFPNYVDGQTGIRTLIEVKARAFVGCSAIRNVTFPSSLTYLGKEAFLGASALRFVKFEGTEPPTIDKTAFVSRSKSFKIYVNSTTETPTKYTTDMNSGWQEYRTILYSSSFITPDGNWSYSVIAMGNMADKLRLIQYIGEEGSVDLDITSGLAIGDDTYKEIGELSSYIFDYVVTAISINSSVSAEEDAFTAAVSLKSFSIRIIDNQNNLSSEVILKTYNSLPWLNTLSMSSAMTLSEFFGGSSIPSNLTHVEIINDYYHREIPESMFAYCTSLTHVTIPTATLKINDYAFKGCTSLVSVTMKNVTEMGLEAFAGCTALAVSGLEIPDKVTKIGEDALKGTKFLDEMRAAGDYVIVGGGVLYKYYGTETLVCIPNNVEVINTKAFMGNSHVRSVYFASRTDEERTIAEIGDYAFANCVFLENVILPHTVSSYGVGAFMNDAKLVKIILIMVEGNTSIGVASMGANAFSGVMSDIKLYLPSDNVRSIYADKAAWTSIFGDRIYGNDMILESNRVLIFENSITVGLLQFFGEENEVEIDSTTTLEASGDHIMVATIYPYSIPRTTTKLVLCAGIELFDDAFAAVTKLTDLTITESESMGMFSEQNSRVLRKLLVANKSLTTLKIGGGATLENVFNGVPSDTSINKVVLLDSTTEIVEGMFRDCVNITEIEFSSNLEMNKVGPYAFENSGWLNNKTEEFVTIPTKSGELVVAYKDTSNVVEFPSDSGVTGIAPCLFENDTDVELVYIYPNITNIYDSAFAGATGLSKIFISGTTEPDCGDDVFSGIASGAEIYVADTSWLTSDVFDGLIKKVDATTLLHNDDDGIDYIVEPITSTTAKLVRILSDGNGKLVSVPEVIGAYEITAIGNNVFMQDTVAIGVRGNDTFSANSFTNLYGLTSLTVYNTSAFIADNGSVIYGVVGANTALTKVSFGGEVTLKAMLGGNDIPNQITSVTILDGSTTLVDNMLAGANAVKDIKIANTVDNIGYNVFEDTSWYLSRSDYVVINSVFYKYKGNGKTPNISNGVTKIIPYAFATYSANGWKGNQLISKISFADSSCKVIEKNAFYGITNLEKVDLPDGIQYVDSEAFIGTKITTGSDGLLIVPGSSKGDVVIKYTGSATQIELPYRVVGITKGAFQGNTTIQKVTLPKSSNLKYVREDAFSGCTSLATFGIDDDNTVLPKIEEIGANAFKSTPWSASTADTIIIAKRLVLYKGSATTLTIGDDIATIASDAFSSVSGMTSVTFTSSTPILASDLGEGALSGIPTIYVPAGSVDIYKAAWPTYASKITAA